MSDDTFVTIREAGFGSSQNELRWLHADMTHHGHMNILTKYSPSKQSWEQYNEENEEEPIVFTVDTDDMSLSSVHDGDEHKCSMTHHCTKRKGSVIKCSAESSDADSVYIDVKCPKDAAGATIAESNYDKSNCYFNILNKEKGDNVAGVYKQKQIERYSKDKYAKTYRPELVHFHKPQEECSNYFTGGFGYCANKYYTENCAFTKKNKENAKFKFFDKGGNDVTWSYHRSQNS